MGCASEVYTSADCAAVECTFVDTIGEAYKVLECSSAGQTAVPCTIEIVTGVECATVECTNADGAEDRTTAQLTASGRTTAGRTAAECATKEHAAG